MVSLFNTCSSPMLPLSGILLRIAECWLLYVSLTWCNESNWDELNSLPSGVIATPSETVTLWPHFLVTGFAYQQEKSSEHQCLEGTFRSAPGILKSTKPVQFGFKNRLVFLWKPDLVTVVKTVFGWFLWFMDRLLPVLKIDGFPIAGQHTSESEIGPCGAPWMLPIPLIVITSNDPCFSRNECCCWGMTFGCFRAPSLDPGDQCCLHETSAVHQCLFRTVF
jgi:hypothetical protein